MTVDAFISYRRGEGSNLASYFHSEIRQRGFSCFLDINEKYAGDFMEVVESEIKNASLMILLVTEGSLERFSNPDDITRREVEMAFKYRTDIMPISAIGDDMFRILGEMVDKPECLIELQKLNTRLYRHELRNDTLHYIYETLENKQSQRFDLQKQEMEKLFSNNTKSNGIPGYLTKVNGHHFEYEGKRLAYTGEIKFGNPHGKATLTDLSTGMYYDLEWDFTSVFSGTGSVGRGTSTLYQGDIVDLRYEGKGKLYESDGTYTGEFSNGKKSGKGTFVGKDGTVRTGTWVSDDFEGTGYIRYPDGSEYRGAVSYGLPNGYGTKILPDGKKVEGKFRSGKIDTGVIHFADKIYSGGFENLIPDGRGILFDIDYNKIFDGRFKKGVILGTGELYLKGAQLAVGIIPEEMYLEIKKHYKNFDTLDVALAGDFNGVKLNMDYTDFTLVNRSNFAKICEGKLLNETTFKYSIYNEGYTKVFEKN